jgi:hypothetical protein
MTNSFRPNTTIADRENYKFPTQRLEEEQLREQQEQQKQQAAAAAQKAEATRQKQQQTFNPLEGVGQALEAARDTIVGLGDAAVGRQRVESLQQGFEEAAYSNPVATTGVEALRAVGSVPFNLLEGVLDTGALVTDTALSPFRRDSDRDPFSDKYVRAKFDLGVQKTKTSVGKAAEGILTFAVGMKLAAAKLPTALVNLGTKGQGLKGAIASGLVPGAVADFLLTSPDDGNLSSLVKDLVPEQHRDSLLLAMAVDDDDNPWEAKIKATLEGGVTGAAVDAVGWMLIGRRAAQRALKSGATKEAAAAAGLKAASDAQAKIDGTDPKRANSEATRWTEAQEQEMQTYIQREQRLTAEDQQLRASGATDDDPQIQNLRLEIEENQLNMAQLDNEIMRGYNLNDPQLTPFERAASVDTSDVNRVAAQQMRLERGPIPASIRSGNLPSGTTVNQATLGGSSHILTDAAYRIINLNDGAEKLVRDTARRTDLQKLAKSLGETDQEVISRAANIVQYVRDTGRPWNEQPDNILELLQESGALMNVRGATDGTAGDILNRSGVVALKTLITDTSNQILELATNADMMASARQAGGNQFDRMMDRLVTMLGLHKETSVFSGGLLRSGRLSLDAPVLNAGNIDEAALSMKQVKEWANKVKDMARRGDPDSQDEMERLIRAMVLAGGDPSKTVNFMTQAYKYGGQALMDGMYSSMLSGPITHLRNGFGNAYALFERPTSIAIQGLVKGDEGLRRAAVAGYHGILTNVGEAWKVAKMTFNTGDSVNLKSKFLLDDFEAEAMIRRMEQVATTDSEKRALGFVHTMRRFFKNPIMDVPSRLLTASDDFFKVLNARQNIQAQAMYKAVSEAASPNDVDGLFKQYMTEMATKMDPTTGRILDPDLLKYVEEATFQQDPGDFINNLTNTLNAQPALRIFVPFIRTPANLLTYAGQHTPGLARFIGDYKKVMASGDAMKIAELQGREAIGTMVAMSAGLAALSGQVTGNGPADPRERAIWERTHQPMSVKIGGKWVSYQGIEPFSSIVSAVADIAGLGAAGSLDSAERLAGQLAFSIAAAVTEKSYVAGLADIAAALDPSNLTPDGFTRGLLGTANNFIPYAGARRALSNALDPYLKEVNGELERAMNAALPGYKLAGTTKIDWLTGEEMSSSAGGLYNAVSPLRITDKGEDPVKDMLVDIRFELGDSQKFGPAGVELNAEQRAALNKGMADSGVYQKLDRLRKQEWFKKDVAKWKNQGFKWSSEENRPRHYTAVNQIVNSARSTAFAKMQRTDPGFAQTVRDARKGAVRARRGVYGEVTDLTTFPN